jgi:ribosome-binding protein aMBF1 (putative translation factor)
MVDRVYAARPQYLFTERQGSPMTETKSKPAEGPASGHSVHPLVRDFVRFSEREAELRGWNMSRVAKEAGISKGNWSEITRGQIMPTLDTVYKISRALGFRVAFWSTPTLSANAESIHPESKP